MVFGYFCFFYIVGIRIYYDGCDLRFLGSFGVMVQKYFGERGLYGVYYSGGVFFRILGFFVDFEIFLFLGFRDLVGIVFNGICCFIEYFGFKYIQYLNLVYWLDLSYGFLGGLGLFRDVEDFDQSEMFLEEELGVDQEFLKENEIGNQKDGNFFFFILFVCNCQGIFGILEGFYFEGGNGFFSNFCYYCIFLVLGEDELEEEYDDEEFFKFFSDFLCVFSGKKFLFWRQWYCFLMKEDIWEGGCRDFRFFG